MRCLITIIALIVLLLHADTINASSVTVSAGHTILIDCNSNVSHEIQNIVVKAGQSIEVNCVALEVPSVMDLLRRRAVALMLSMEKEGEASCVRLPINWKSKIHDIMNTKPDMLVYERLGPELARTRYGSLITNYMHTYLLDLQALFKVLASYRKTILVSIEPSLFSMLKDYESKTGVDVAMMYAKIKYDDIDCGQTEEDIPALMKCITRLAKYASLDIKIGFSYPLSSSSAFMRNLGVFYSDFVIAKDGTSRDDLVDMAVPVLWETCNFSLENMVRLRESGGIGVIKLETCD
jgi:hypothetical protein